MAFGLNAQENNESVVVGDFVFKTENGVHYLVQYSGADTSLVLPESYKGESYAIGDSVFIGNRNIVSVVIPDAVTEIGVSAFGFCYNCAEVTLGKSVTKIGERAFYGNSRITEMSFPEGLLSIGKYAFSRTNLTRLILPESLVSMGYNAFSGIPNLKEVINHSPHFTIKKSFVDVSAVGEDNPSHVGYYATVVINTKTDMQDGDYYFRTENDTTFVVQYVGSETELSLPETYKGKPYEIGDGAFANMDNLTEISIPGTITSIGKCAFYRCAGLKRFTVPSSVTCIGANAFSGCSNIRSVINHADFVIEKQSPGYGNLGNFASMIINTKHDVQEGDYYFRTENDTNYLVQYVGSDTRLMLPESFKGEPYLIGRAAFAGMEDIVSAVIPNSVKEIGSGAFLYCRNLVGLSMGNEVSVIKAATFSGCENLASMNLHEGITVIERDAFYGCKKLTTITIPKSVNSIGDYAFRGCTGLVTINIPEKISRIEEYTFDGCSSLANVVIPQAVTYIGERAFKNCGQLTNVVIPDLVTFIGSRSFSGCDNLKYVYMGASVESIGGHAFDGCVSLQGLACAAAVPPVCEDYVFSDEYEEYSAYATCSLYVPEASIEVYRSTEPWLYFKNIEGIKVDTSYHYIAYLVDGEAYAIDSAKVGALIVPLAEPVKEGYTFSGWKGLTETMPAQDIVVSGTFSINTYAITYIVDGEVYATDSVVYGERIVLMAEPEKDGYAFFGWSEVPETMPANDLIVEGRFEKVDGIDGITLGSMVDVYSMEGVLLKRQTTLETLRDELPQGLYIIRSANNVKKMVVE